MNKLNIAIAGAIAATGLAMAAPASADQYVSAQLGVSQIGNYTTPYGSYSFDNGLALIATYGHDIPAVHKYFGIEGEVSKSIVNPSVNSYWYGYGVSADYDYWTAGAYAVFSIPVTDKVSIRARGGLVYNHWTISDCVAGFGCYDYSSNDINPSIGGGATYKLNENINLMAEVTAFSVTDSNFHVSAGAQFKF